MCSPTLGDRLRVVRHRDECFLRSSWRTFTMRRPWKRDESARNWPVSHGTSVPALNALFSDGRLAALTRVVSGEAEEDEIAALVGVSLDVFQARGIINAFRGSTEWRALGRLLASVEIEAQRRSNERDMGYYGGTPTFPPLTRPRPADLHVEAVSLKTLLADYTGELQRSGRGSEAARRWRPCIEHLIAFLGHDDARGFSRQDVINWRDQLLTTLAPKTVRDAHVTALKAVLNWGVESGRLEKNVADGVKVRVPAQTMGRERGLTDGEAKSVLEAATSYRRKVRSNSRTSESVFVAAAKRWAPWLCAFSGARIAEITQLRKCDVSLDGAIPFFRITPDAGSVKTGTFRDVPLHPQLIDLGFGEFVRAAQAGPLFFEIGDRKGRQHPSKQVAQRLASWLRSLGIIGPEVDPNHGWRHRMKTIARELGLEMRVVDSIQGHAPRTAGERYGDVSLAAKNSVMIWFPSYEINQDISCPVSRVGTGSSA